MVYLYFIFNEYYLHYTNIFLGSQQGNGLNYPVLNLKLISWNLKLYNPLHNFVDDFFIYLQSHKKILATVW